MALVTLLPLCLAAAATAAPDWPASFAPASLSTIFGEGSAVLVTAADGSSREAASALAASLRASSQARLVMDDTALGDLSGLSDAQIVQRSQGLPIARVAVVRVFPREGAPPTGVIALYDLSGARLAGGSQSGGCAGRSAARRHLQPRAAPRAGACAHESARSAHRHSDRRLGSPVLSSLGSLPRGGVGVPIHAA